MNQLELISISIRYLSPEECVEKGYALFEADALRCLMIPIDEFGNILKYDAEQNNSFLSTRT